MCSRFAARLAFGVGSLLAGDVLRADQPPPRETVTAKLAVLEARLAAVREESERLSAQWAASRPDDLGAQRNEALRKQVRSILSESEFRESLAPSTAQAGFDNGFYIRSRDGPFTLKVNGRFQFRVTYYDAPSRNRYLAPRLERDDRVGLDLPRLRLSLRGNAYTQDLTYLFEFSADGPARYDLAFEFAYVNYRLVDAFQVRAGAFRLASTRAQMTTDANLQFVDRPMTDAVYSLGDGLGVRFWGHLHDRRVEYYLDVVNALNNASNRTITNDPPELDHHPAIVFHALWYALGPDPAEDFTLQADLPRHETPAWVLGFMYAFNDDQGDQNSTRIPLAWTGGPRGVGGFGLTSTNGLAIHQFGLDSAFKWRGFSATGEYIVRLVDPRHADRAPITPWTALTGDGSTTAQHGAYVQVGYLLPIPGLEDKLEAVARVGGIAALAEEREGAWEYAGGLNYYIQGSKLKLVGDVTRIQEAPISSSLGSLANVNDQALVFRMQLQVAF